MPTRTISFLYNMVVGEFLTNRTYETDRQIVAMTDAISKAAGEKDPFHQSLAQTILLTNKLTFTWPEGTPDNLRAFETFWTMYKSGREVAEWWKYYSSNVDNLVILGQNALFRIERLTQEDIDKADLKDRLSIEDGVLYKNVQIQRAVKGWNACMKEAQKAWIPPKEWLLLQELPVEEQIDPL